MKRLAFWLLAAVALLAVLAIVAAVALPHVVDTPRIQAFIAASASHALGRPVTFSSVELKLFPRPAVDLKGLQVGEDPRFGTSPFVRLERGEVRLRLRPLLVGRAEFGEVVLHKPVIALVQDAQGRWNFASVGVSPEPRAPAPRPRAGAGAAAPLAANTRIQDGVVTLLMRSGGAQFRVEGLDLAVSTRGGTAAVKGSARVEPGGLALRFDEATVALAPGKSIAEAAVTGKVTVDGHQVRDLVRAALGPEPAVAGGVKATLALAGTVGDPRASGDVKLSDVAVTRTNPACAAPKERTLKVDPVKLHVAWESGQLTARPVETGLGGGTVTTTMIATLEHGGHVQLRDLGIRGVPVERLLVDFLCQGYAVTGPLDHVGFVSFDAGDPWGTLAGSGQLRIGPGKVVGSQALVVLGGVTRMGGAVSSLLSGETPGAGASALEFESITGTYRIANGVVTTRDLVYTSREMRASLAGDYALASGRVNFDVVLDHGRGQIRAAVTGSASSPAIRVNPESVLRSVDPSRVQSGLQELLRRLR